MACGNMRTRKKHISTCEPSLMCFFVCWFFFRRFPLLHDSSFHNVNEKPLQPTYTMSSKRHNNKKGGPTQDKLTRIAIVSDRCKPKKCRQVRIHYTWFLRALLVFCCCAALCVLCIALSIRPAAVELLVVVLRLLCAIAYLVFFFSIGLQTCLSGGEARQAVH
jgi:lipopolysaccharide export LptBFGC system permease protein LptF